MTGRQIAAGVLALPVIALVYVEAVGSTVVRRRATVGPGVITLAIAAVLVVAFASNLGGRPATDVARTQGQPTPSVEAVVTDAPSTPVAAASPSAAASTAPSTAPSVAPSASPTPPLTPGTAPSVVRFRPRDGARGVARSANLSVRFTAPMARRATEAAFSATANGRPIRGRLSWAERSTVLVLDPARLLPAGATVVLAVGEGATSADGTKISAPAKATFRVAGRSTSASPTPTPEPSSSTTAVSSGWAWPLIGPITQGFGEQLTQFGVHRGIDIDGETGDRVLAARTGKVIVAGRYDACGGLEVHVDHGDGLVTWYRHLSKVETKVSARVAQGALIGRVGDTGCAEGSHLHFAIRQGDDWLDPLDFLPPR